jgi:hypothetical protein
MGNGCLVDVLDMAGRAMGSGQVLLVGVDSVEGHAGARSSKGLQTCGRIAIKYIGSKTAFRPRHIWGARWILRKKPSCRRLRNRAWRSRSHTIPAYKVSRKEERLWRGRSKDRRIAEARAVQNSHCINL